MTEQLTFSLYSYYVHSLAWKLVAGPVEFSREEDISPYYRTSHQCSICFRLFLFLKMYSFLSPSWVAAAAVAKSRQTLCDPMDGSPLGSPVPGILQARTLEWVAISFSNASKWKVKVKSLLCVRLLATSWTTAYHSLPSMGFSKQEYWSGVPSPSPSWGARGSYTIKGKQNN